MNHVDTTEQSPTCITLCYGIGGLDEGLERVVGPLRNLCVVEIEAVAIANVVAKMETGNMAPCPVWPDVKTFPAHIFRDRVDWLLGGYPCTPFSLAGKRKGADDPRHLWPYFERIIETVRPIRCLFENVDDHLTLGFPEVYCSLRRLGYSVEVGVYSAAEAGAPHERLRMFILAVRNDALADTSHEREFQYEKGFGIDKDEEQLNSLQESRRHNVEGWIRGECDTFSHASELGNPTIITKREQADEANAITERGEAWNESSRSGEPQQAWESPRVISREVESSVGLSTDGYNFREDFLRALGNMVVSATAEIAIRDLLRKHRIA